MAGTWVSGPMSKSAHVRGDSYGRVIQLIKYTQQATTEQ